MNKNNKYACGLILFTVAVSMMLTAITPSWAQVTFKPPKDLAPKRSTGGASRDASSCGVDMASTTQASVTPLLPKTNIGLTLAQRPTIFVYIPPTKAKKALFNLQDEQGKQYYQTTLPVPSKRGVIAIKLPSSLAPLKTGRNYQWSLVMICTQELEPDSPLVNGWIRRVEANRSFNHLSGLEVVSELAGMGIWYDSLAALADLRRKQPNNPTVTTSWGELLKSVDLNAIANEPLIN